MDESLREEIRNVSTPSDRLRVAAKLERAGLGADAQAVLEPALEDELVRKELVRFPAWSHEQSDGGRTFWIDAAPIEKRPRELWRAHVLTESERFDRNEFFPAWIPEPFRGADQLLASPLGVVVTLGDGFALFDPRTGERRLMCGVDRATDTILWGESFLLPCSGELRDLWTGEVVFRPVVLRGSVVATPDRALLAMLAGMDHPQRIVLRRPDDESATSGPLGWYAANVYVARGLAVGRFPHDLVAVELPGGRELWRHANPGNSGGSCLVDESGVVATAFPKFELASSYDSKGKLLWQREDEAPRALAPDFVLLHARGRLVALSREGKPLWECPAWRLGMLAVARDVVYAWATLREGDAPALVAIRGGEELWRIEGSPKVARLAAISRRLFALTTDGEVLALVE